jgi:hypothetical protein
MAPVTEEQIGLYVSLFRGRENTYTRRWKKKAFEVSTSLYELSSEGILKLEEVDNFLSLLHEAN